MAIVLEANYAKKLGLPNYSSHQYSVTIRTELTDLTQVEAESTRLYGLLQDAVDREIQKVGFMADASTYGMKPSQNGGNGHPSNETGNGSNGHGPQRNNDPWNCTDGHVSPALLHPSTHTKRPAMSLSILPDTPSFFYNAPWWLRIIWLLVIFRGFAYVVKLLPKMQSPSRIRPQAESRLPETPMPAPPTTATGASNGIVVLGYVCAFVALFLLPPFIGLAGVICGVVAIKRQQINQWIALMIVNFICAAVGMIIGAMNTQ